MCVFKKIGTTLNKERFEKVDFDGKPLTLPVAPLDLEPAGNVNRSPIGDYKLPLKRSARRQRSWNKRAK